MLWIVQGRDHARRFVQGVIERRRRQFDALTIYFYAVFEGIGLRAQLVDHRTVDRDAPFDDPALGLATGCQTRPRNNLLEPFHEVSKVKLPPPVRAEARRLKSPGARSRRSP